MQPLMDIFNNLDTGEIITIGVVALPYIKKFLSKAQEKVVKKIENEVEKEVEQNEDVHVIKDFMLKILKLALKIIALGLFVPSWLLDKLIEILNKLQKFIGQKK